MNARKRPSVIVMKRLDTQGMRVLSQSAGEGTRRAGVRLSPKGGLLVHRRGEPITSAPPPPSPADAKSPIDASAPTLLAPVTFIPTEVRAFAKASLERQIQDGRGHSDAPLAAPVPLPALRIAPAPRRSLALWSMALVTLGLLTGVTIARLVGSSQVAAGRQVQSDAGDLPVVAPQPATDLGSASLVAVAAAPLAAKAVDAPLVAPNVIVAPSAPVQAAPLAAASASPPRRHHRASKPAQAAAEDAKGAEPKPAEALEGADVSATSALVREQLGNSL